MAELDRANIMASIDAALRDLLFEDTKVFYFHLEHAGIPYQTILDEPKEFVEALRKIFGNGFVLVESAIISHIAKNLNLQTSLPSNLQEMLEKLCGGEKPG